MSNSTDSGGATRTGKLSVGKAAVRQYIDDQAGNGLINSWREAVQNAIDAPESDYAHLMFTHLVSVIVDNGRGMELTEDKVEEEILTTFGETTKERDDDSTYGQFGVGFGQVLAKGAVVVLTRDSVVVFDVKDKFTAEELAKRVPGDPFPDLDEWDGDEPHPLEQASGLGYALTDRDRHVDGFAVVIHHYADEVPEEGDVEWENYEEEFRDKFQHVPRVTDVDIAVNNDPVEPADPLDTDDLRGEVRTTETENAFIAVSNSVMDKITVYSRGLKVCDVDGEGLQGHVITKENLDVNLARNEIKSGDQTWQEIKDTIEELRVDILDGIDDGRLYGNARRAMLKRMDRDPELREKWGDRQIVPLTNDTQTTIERMQSRKSVGFAGQDDQMADKVIEAGELVLDAGSREVEIIRSGEFDIPEAFDVQERADELDLTDDYEVLDDADLNERQRRQLLFARCLAAELSEYVPGLTRQIKWGRHDGAAAWTNGATYIVLTDSVPTSRRREVWMADIRDTLIHESIHDDNNATGGGHPPSFSEAFRERIEHPNAREAYAELVEEVVEKGFERTFRDHGFDPEYYR